jgi:radical SAM protein with 4Fe4S-binding SPASM domain
VQLVLGDQSLSEVLTFIRRWADTADAVEIKRYSTRGGRLSITRGARLGGGAARRRPCLDPWLNVVIRSDGGVVPCCTDFGGELVLGSLHESTMAEIWNGERARGLRRAHASGTGLPDICRRCTDYRSPGEDDRLVIRDLPSSTAELERLLDRHPRHLIFEPH